MRTFNPPNLQQPKPSKRLKPNPPFTQPSPSIFQSSLPITKYRHRICQLILQNQVTIISGQTGSGKTTQVPQYLLPLYPSICISQPRRISAITLSRRVAEELHCQLGQTVGYSVRFDEKRSQQTRIHFVTDGMAIREMMLGKRYEVFVLDQAHERSVNTDVLLAILKRRLRRNPRMRLVVMSATIQVSRFLSFFDSDAHIAIQGRTFPIHLYYTLEPVPDYLRATINCVLQLHLTQPPGDILVFLTGQQQITTAQKLLKQKTLQIPSPQHRNLSILPLFAALPSELQLSAFSKPQLGQRKVILSTNIAETSVTIDGIKYVVDCGFCKMRVFDHERNMEVLAVVPVSKASALQRAGRAGRQYEGKCYRLYVKNSFEELPDYHLPEILRVDITSSILQLKTIGVGKVKEFQFMDPPSAESFDYSLQLLRDIGAIDQTQTITPRGHQLSQLPLPPQLSHLLLLSLQPDTFCPDMMLTCVSLLTTQNLFYLPQKHSLFKVLKRYEVTNSDHLTKLNIFHQYLFCTNKKSFCKENHLNSKSVRRVVEVREQLEGYLVGVEMDRARREHFQKKKLTEEEIRVRFKPKEKIKRQVFLQCLAKGACRKTARLCSDGTYTISHSNQSARIHPESICFMVKPKPEKIVFSEIIKTQKVFLRDVSEIQVQEK